MFWQIHEPRADRCLVIINTTHFNCILAGVAREGLNALQCVDILENLDKVIRKQADYLLESWRQDKEVGSKGVPYPM
jgi:hypothetical protein